MNRMFEEDEDVAVMEPMVGTKKRKTVYVDDILDKVGRKGPVLSDWSGKELLDSVFAQPKNGKETHVDKEATYVNVEELAQQLHEPRIIYLVDMYKRINGWIVKALESKRKITISFKDASDETLLKIGAIIGDIYDRFPEEQIDEFMHITDISSHGEWKLSNEIRMARLYRDDPVAYAKLQEKILKIMEGDY